MPKPFPLALSIGTDICSVARVFNILQTRFGPPFMRKILAPEEWPQAEARVEKHLIRWKNCLAQRKYLETKRISLGLDGDRDFAIELDRIVPGSHSFALKSLQSIVSPVELQEGVSLHRGMERVIFKVKEQSFGDSVNENPKTEETFKAIFLERLKQDRMKQLQSHRGAEVDVLAKLWLENVKEAYVTFRGAFRGAAFLAGRFSAKEAVIKAHPNRTVLFHEIVITPTPTTSTEAGRMTKPVAVVLPRSRNFDEGQEVLLSISHDGDYATAVCLAMAEPGRQETKIPRKATQDGKGKKATTRNRKKPESSTHPRTERPEIKEASKIPDDEIDDDIDDESMNFSVDNQKGDSQSGLNMATQKEDESGSDIINFLHKRLGGTSQPDKNKPRKTEFEEEFDEDMANYKPIAPNGTSQPDAEILSRAENGSGDEIIKFLQDKFKGSAGPGSRS